MLHAQRLVYAMLVFLAGCACPAPVTPGAASVGRSGYEVSCKNTVSSCYQAIKNVCQENGYAIESESRTASGFKNIASCYVTPGVRITR